MAHEHIPRQYLPTVSSATFESIKADIAAGGGVEAFADKAEDRMLAENRELFTMLGYLAGVAGWSEEQSVAARQAAALACEVLSRQSEADAMDRMFEL